MSKVTLNILIVSVSDISYERNALSVFTRALVLLMLASTLILPGCAGQDQALATPEPTPTIITSSSRPTVKIEYHNITTSTPEIQANNEKITEERHYLNIDEKTDLYTLDWEDYSEVESMYISRNSIDCAYILSVPIIKQLDFLYIYCTGDEPLVINTKTMINCSYLKVLDLNNVVVEDAKLFYIMPYLQELEISHADVRCDLSPLSWNGLLSYLSFENSYIKYIRTLPRSQSIEKLYIKNCGVSDITALSGMKNLTYLNLEKNNISNIEPFRGLSKLRILDLTGNKVSDFSPLKGTTELTELYATCDSEKVTIIDSFAYLEKIDTLYLYDAHITDIAPLKNMRDMWMLKITGENNTFSDIKPIKYLKDMISLELESNGILKDLKPIKGADNLTHICLCFGGYGDLSPLAQRDNIRLLDIVTNSYIDITPIANMKSLQYIKLTANMGIETDKYIDITPLARNDSLKTINLKGNGIIDAIPFKDAGSSLERLDLMDTIDIDQIGILLESSPDYVISCDYNTIHVREDIDPKWLDELKKKFFYCEFVLWNAGEWYKLEEVSGSE